MREQIVGARRHGDELLGTLSVDNTLTGRPLPETQAEVLVTFAQQVGTALENARLTEAEARARQSWSPGYKTGGSSRRPIPAASRNMSAWSAPAISQVGCRLMVASSANTSLPWPPAACGDVARALATNAAISDEADGIVSAFPPYVV